MKAKRRGRILYPRSTLTPTREGRKIDDVLDSHSRKIAEDRDWRAIHVTGPLGSRLNEPPDESFPADDPWAEEDFE